MDVNREQLFKPRLPEETYELPGLGELRIRGLSRGEVLAAQADDPSLALFERRLIARAVMLDPPLTHTDVGRWQEASPAGELEPLIERIRQLSGLSDGAEKEAYRSFRDGPEPRVRDDASSETVNDSGEAASGDER